MKIALIDASPKKKGSISGYLLRELCLYTGERNECLWVGLHGGRVGEREQAMLAEADAWVIAAGLYVDGLPSHLLSVLEDLRPLAGRKPSGPLSQLASPTKMRLSR